jgi:hypothetical protein
MVLFGLHVAPLVSPSMPSMPESTGAAPLPSLLLPELGPRPPTARRRPPVDEHMLPTAGAWPPAAGSEVEEGGIGGGGGHRH